MSQIEEQIEPVFEGSGYPIIAWANGQKLIHYHEFGSYQGEWLMLAKGEAEYFIYKDWYGSCSSCDSYQSENPRTLSEAKKFAEDYRPFIEIPISTMRNLLETVSLAKVFPANIRGGEVDVDEFVADAAIAAKLTENMQITAADIIACKNQEIKQEALRQFGYDNFVRDAGMEELDREGEDALLRKDGIVFAHVKDASTPRRYLLRVPPNMTTIKDAIAWTFGMTAAEYRPLAET